jgi:CRISPR-associated protein Csd1
LDPEYVENDTTVDQTGRKLAEAALKSAAEKVKRAQKLDIDTLMADLKSENPRFFILGLSPVGEGRISVRFFITDLFEKIVGNIMAHYRDLEIVKEFSDQPDYLTIRRVLYETVSKKSSDRNATPLLAGAVFRSILTNTPYPAVLYYAIINRIRADMDDSQKGIRKINYTRAAIIKAFLARKYRHQPRHPFKEVLTMSLNEQSNYPPYVLGRLFAVLEKSQKDANPKLNKTIKDRYFTSACASPRIAFPTLLRLSQHHIAKAEYGYANDRRIQELLNLLDLEENPIPARLTLDEQGAFVLGYYHQRADFFTPKTDAKETKP